MSSKDMKEALARQLMASMVDTHDDGRPKAPQRTMPMQARVLTDLLPEIIKPNPFRVGDLVTQSTAYTQYNWPQDGAVAIVSAVVELPTVRIDSKGRNRFDREDMVVLCNVDGKWIEIYPVDTAFDQVPAEYRLGSLFKFTFIWTTREPLNPQVFIGDTSRGQAKQFI